MRNSKLYLVESEVPRVKSYLGLTKARSQPESAVYYCTKYCRYLLKKLAQKWYLIIGSFKLSLPNKSVLQTNTIFGLIFIGRFINKWLPLKTLKSERD